MYFPVESSKPTAIGMNMGSLTDCPEFMVSLHYKNVPIASNILPEINNKK
jgi:hypothetical protein